MRKEVIAGVLSLLMAFGLCIQGGTAEVCGAEAISKQIVSADWLQEQHSRSRAMSLSLNQQEMNMLYFTNKVRMTNGLEPLSTFEALQKAADVRGSELGTLFDHQRPDGTMCYTALDQEGISYTSAAENIAAGLSDPVATFDSWWNSPGHQANMMNADFSHMGVGYDYLSGTEYGHYWVQLFTGGCSPTEIRVMGDEGYIFLIPAGESLDNLNLTLEADCQHGTSYLPITDEMCSGYNPDSLYTNQEIQVEYRGCTTSFYIYPYPPMQFTDVSPENWYYGYVEYVYALQLMTGKNDTFFGASENLTREQFALILYRIQGEPDVSGLDPVDFPDVEKESWYEDAVTWASYAGIIEGYTDGPEAGRFGTSDPITRAQMATMMYRYAKYLGMDVSASADLGSYPDAWEVPDFAAESMSWAVGAGIISGDDSGPELQLMPQGSASRAVGATIITRFLSGM